MAESLKKLLSQEDKVDFGEFKDTVRDLNDAIDAFNSRDGKEEGAEDLTKIRVVGIKKKEMLTQWHDIVDYMAGQGYEDIPESSVNFWNKWCPEEGAAAAEEEEEAAEEQETEAAAPEEKKEKPKAKAKAKGKGNLPPGRNVVTSFEDIQKQLKEPQTPTAMFDKLTLAGGTVESLLAKYKKYLADTNPSFKSITTPNAVKSHIAYRESKGWVYEKDEEKGTFKLVGFEKKK